MKVLVSGSSSDLGKSICNKLVKNKHEVYAMYNLNPPTNLATGKIKIIKHNLLNNFIFDKKYDAFIHVASAMPSKSLKYADYIKINFYGYKKIIIKAVKNGCKSFIFISTTSVYEKNIKKNLTENSNINPQNYYAKSKLKAENFLIDYAKKYNLNYFILRLPAILKKNSRKNFISSLIDKIKKNEKIDIENKNFKFNNMVHVENVSSIILHVLKKKKFSFLFNLGCLRPLKIKNMIKIIGKKMNKKLNINFIKSTQQPFQIKVNSKLIKNFKIYSCRKALSSLLNNSR